jgi:hypothetical protein
MTIPRRHPTVRAEKFINSSAEGIILTSEIVGLVDEVIFRSAELSVRFAESSGRFAEAIAPKWRG